MSLEKFIEYLDIEKNYSKHTIIAYKTDLINFQDFLIESNYKVEIESADYKFIRLWIVKLANEKISNRTINRKISSLKSFYKFLVKTGTIKISPLLAHSPLKQSKKIQVPFSVEEINNLLDNDYFKDDYNGILKKTIIVFFYFTGVRRIELISLKSSDIDLDSSTVKILGKRNKERIIPILPKLKEAITDYLSLKSNTFKSIIRVDLFPLQRVIEHFQKSFVFHIYKPNDTLKSI